MSKTRPLEKLSLAAQLEADDKVFVWYSGHGLSNETGATLLVTQPELSDVDEDVEVVDGLWLEDTVYEIFEPVKCIEDTHAWQFMWQTRCHIIS